MAVVFIKKDLASIPILCIFNLFSQGKLSFKLVFIFVYTFENKRLKLYFLTQ